MIFTWPRLHQGRGSKTNMLLRHLPTAGARLSPDLGRGAAASPPGAGAGAWDAKRREAYANDQDAATFLVAVTARTNRSKADQGPAEWMPPLPDAHCRHVGEWTATELRWGLAADQVEADALKAYAETCETTVALHPRLVAPHTTSPET
ncbi:hypothetical protein [Streptomyces roseolus]|uniref:hypothetical protein n=1 Tax=Streptomyces roseolus TaxID=67358 RepID=UPI00364FD8CA